MPIGEEGFLLLATLFTSAVLVILPLVFSAGAIGALFVPLDFLFDIIVDVLLDRADITDTTEGDSGSDFPTLLIPELLIDFFLVPFFFFVLSSVVSVIFTEALLLLSDVTLMLTSSVVTPVRGDGLDLEDGNTNPDIRRGGVFDGVDSGDSDAVDGDFFEFTYFVLSGESSLAPSLKLLLLTLGNMLDAIDVDEVSTTSSTTLLKLACVVTSSKEDVLKDSNCSTAKFDEMLVFFDIIPYLYSNSGNVTFM